MSASASTRPRASSRPSLAPREHGAYVFLGFPLLTGLYLSGATIAASLFLVAFVAAFLAHEPIVLLLGHRGPRALREQGQRARRRIVGLTLIGLGAGMGAFLLSPLPARIAASSCAALAAIVLLLLRAGREKTLVGEAMVVIAFASTGLPLALTAAVPMATAASVASIWVLTFTLETLCVKATLSRRKEPNRILEGLALLVPIACALGLIYPLLRGQLFWLTAAPGIAGAIALGLVRPSPRHLPKVGWVLAGIDLGTLGLLIHFAA
ncbi:MAG: YwiC-like family protein [Myxococcales bacterium]|nr:YwiC-like family protein [Myxococcales bacterium]